jgi:uncharacterized protein (TIGR00369 family)
MGQDDEHFQSVLDAANAPAGFEPSLSRGSFTSHNGPFFHKVEGDEFWHGFRALDRHANSHGILHGGLLMTFADGLLATAVWRETQARAVTVRMNSDFIDMARAGEWVQGTAKLSRATRTMAFAEATVNAGNRLIFTATGVFKLFRRSNRT